MEINKDHGNEIELQYINPNLIYVFVYKLHLYVML
jgi:hypothetical protein